MSDPKKWWQQGSDFDKKAENQITGCFRVIGIIILIIVGIIILKGFFGWVGSWVKYEGQTAKEWYYEYADLSDCVEFQLDDLSSTRESIKSNCL